MTTAVRKGVVHDIAERRRIDLTAELVGRYRHDRPPYSAICLSSETSSLTAITNDYPPTELFARQVEAHGRAGDVLVLMSTSGRSPNILEAAQRGRQRGLSVWAFTGQPPNPLGDSPAATQKAAATSISISGCWASQVPTKATRPAVSPAPPRAGGRRSAGRTASQTTASSPSRPGIPSSPATWKN